MRVIGTAAWVAAAFLLASPANAQTPKAMTESEIKSAGGRQLQGAEIKQMNLGNTSYTLVIRDTSGIKAGSAFPVYHRDERTRVIRLLDRRLIEGNWWIEGNTYCNEQRVANIGHQCYTIWDIGGTTYSCLQPAGDCMFTSRIVPGNPENL